MKGGKMKKILLITGILALLSTGAYALDGIEILTGYMNASLDEKDDYEGIPLLVSLYYDAEPTFAKIGLKEIPGRLDFIVEPFVNTMYGPDSNVEVGSNTLIKYAFPLTDKFHPYLKGGLGMLYMSQHTREQGTQYNFLPQGAAGFQFFIDENSALSFEYRYRHLSNNSFDSPNSGIDSDMILGGVCFFFD